MDPTMVALRDDGSVDVIKSVYHTIGKPGGDIALGCSLAVTGSRESYESLPIRKRLMIACSAVALGAEASLTDQLGITKEELGCRLDQLYSCVALYTAHARPAEWREWHRDDDDFYDRDYA